MFDRLKRLYDSGRLTATGLQAAVARTWITADEYEQIVGEPYREVTK